MLGYWVVDGERKRRRDGEGASGLIDLGISQTRPDGQAVILQPLTKAG
jgi:hypothetical protein